MTITSADIAAWLGTYLWPFTRIGAMLGVVPVFGARSVPVRVRLALAIALTLVLAPVIPPAPAVDALGARALLIAVQQVVIGLAMGFALQMAFAALSIGSQAIATSMGLGFASMIDPQSGVQVPVLSQFYLLLATLIFLALNGHLILIEVLADSFRVLPVGMQGVTRSGFWALAGWAGQMFAGAALIALPAVAALQVVNLAFGVMTRAAPQLNIFSVGFPITLMLGLVVVLMTLPDIQSSVMRLSMAAFELMRRLAAGGSG